MSIFCLGGTEEVVPEDELLLEMCTDRYFKPGVLHGGDYLIRVFMHDDAFEVEYITKELIEKAWEQDPGCREEFEEVIDEGCENFICHNGSGEFHTIVDCWHESYVMQNEDLVAWANEKYIYQ